VSNEAAYSGGLRNAIGQSRARAPAASRSGESRREQGSRTTAGFSSLRARWSRNEFSMDRNRVRDRRERRASAFMSPARISTVEVGSLTAIPRNRGAVDQACRQRPGRRKSLQLEGLSSTNYAAFILQQPANTAWSMCCEDAFRGERRVRICYRTETSDSEVASPRPVKPGRRSARPWQSVTVVDLVVRTRYSGPRLQEARAVVKQFCVRSRSEIVAGIPRYKIFSVARPVIQTRPRNPVQTEAESAVSTR